VTTNSGGACGILATTPQAGPLTLMSIDVLTLDLLSDLMVILFCAVTLNNKFPFRRAQCCNAFVLLIAHLCE